jgi:hypothetical protein
MFFAPYATPTGGLAKPRSSDASASSRWARGDREGLVERGHGPARIERLVAERARHPDDFLHVDRHRLARLAGIERCSGP